MVTGWSIGVSVEEFKVIKRRLIRLWSILYDVEKLNKECVRRATETHGLACCKSAGRHFRHNAVKYLIKRTLASAETSAKLEPASLSRSDGKWPDGLTIVSWARGRSIVWYFTCPDTLALSHLNRAVVGSSAVANEAEEKKKSKYISLSSLYDITLIAVETLGAVGLRVGVGFFPGTGTPRRQLNCCSHVHSRSWCSVNGQWRCLTVVFTARPYCLQCRALY